MKQEKWCRGRVCLCDRVVACNLTVAASATFSAKKSRTRAAKSRDKIARVTAILGLGWGDYGQVDASARGLFIARVRVLELLW